MQKKHCWHWSYVIPDVSYYLKCCFCGIERFIKQTMERKPVEGHGKYRVDIVTRNEPPSIPDNAECPAREEGVATLEGAST